MQQAAAELRDFLDGFARSRKGNLWRHWGDLTLTIFSRRGSYAYCIAGRELPDYSDEEFDTEEDALKTLAFDLGVGQLCDQTM